MAQKTKRPTEPSDQRPGPKDEQGAPIESVAPTPPVDRPAEEVIREKEREEYRYGGIPIGSDPRE